MSMGEMPRVCSNCKWADVKDDTDNYPGHPSCHRYPVTETVDAYGWCGEFATAWGTREMRYDLPCPPYQRTRHDAK